MYNGVRGSHRDISHTFDDYSDHFDLDTASSVTLRMDDFLPDDHTPSATSLSIDGLVDQHGQAIHGTVTTSPTGDTSIDTTIAPWVMDEPPSPPLHPPTHSASSSRGFSKGSLSSFWPLNSTVSLLRTARPSESATYLAVPDGKRRSTDDAESVRLPQASPPSGPGELRKSKSSIFSRIRRRGSKSHLNQSSADEVIPPPPLPSRIDAQYIFNTPVDPPHPLAHLAPPPPLPPKGKEREERKDKEREREREREAKRRKKKKDSAPDVPPKDDTPLYPLDTNLESMEGIVDLKRGASELAVNPSSPGSATMVFEAQQPVEGTAAMNNPPTFSDPFSPASPSDSRKAIVFGHPRISPTTILPETTTENVNPDGQERDWRPPESWAVVDQTELEEPNPVPEMAAPDDDDSSDEETRTVRSVDPPRPLKSRVMRARMYPPSLNPAESIRPSKRGRGRGGITPEDTELAVRIYRTNGWYHMAALGMSLTVFDLLPALHRRAVADEKHASRLFLKERAKERMLEMREVPFDIIYRRQKEAGYTWNDGLILLAGDQLSFLLKFIYRDPDIGLGRRSFTSDPHNVTLEETEVRLENFDYVDLTGRSLRAIPVILHQHADQIISLKLSRNPMIDLPLDFVEACTQLRDLRLSNMSMRKVPANLIAAKWLRRLDLSFNHIKVKELEGGRLHKIPELSSLYLQNNLLKDLPSSFADLQSLTTLNISNNKLKCIPKPLTTLTSLRDLDVSFNYLEDLPENIGDLEFLERFLFVGNAIAKIPNSFYFLRNLTYVDCRRNQITDLTIICNLPQLKKLYADHNSVHLLDLSMGPNLTVVDVSHNEITQIALYPGPVGQPPHSLTILDLSHASLTTFDDAVLSNLTALTKLMLQHNNLSYIPNSLNKLTELEALICYDNRLIKLPDSIGELPKLRQLDVHNNNLREVPTTIWNCQGLVSLNLSSNFVTDFPPPSIIPINGRSVDGLRTVEAPTNYNRHHVILGHLYPPLSFCLQYLAVSENKLKDPNALRNVAFIRSLLSLNLSYNEISDIPSGFFREMTKLREFYFSGNEVTTLPAEELARLKDLHTLFLSGNKLTGLPAELSRLENLRVIDVSNNNLRYNINNYEFDWNWNFNRNIRFLNLSGNKRLQIKPDSRHSGTSRSSRELNYGTSSLSGFASLRQLRNLGLMDVTVTASDAYVDLPDENEDRRIRSTASVVGGLGYGMSDCLGKEGALTMLDLVHEFPGHPNKALFAMFGNTNPPKALPPGISPNRHAKYLHDHFLEFFQNQLANLEMQESKDLVVDVIRRSFLGLHQAIHYQLFTSSARKMSARSALGGGPTLYNVDPVTARGGCSGIVVYIEDKRLFAANVGTALGVIACKSEPFLVSRKHDPWDPDELRRMRKSEGWISPGGLVNDQVEVSRSFGYYHMLPVVNAAPDMFEWDISDKDDFLIIGNQGLWDYVSFSTAADIASTTKDPMVVSQKLRDFAISYGSTGSIMVMAIRLRDAHDKSLVRSSNFLDPSSTIYAPPPRHSGPMVVDKSIRRAEPEVAPPTGHIALVFTDIRNSTHLWEVNPGMPAAIQLHNDLMRRRLRDCGGYEFKTEGDAFLCSFPTVLSAVWFCLSVQEQLLQENWPLEILECDDGKAITDGSGNLVARGVSVRMGIHCGAPLCAQDPVTHRMDYLGPVINRAARVSGLAQGGQIMCSADVIREIRASILEAGPKTEYSKVQPAKAIDGIKQLGVVIIDVGNKKLKGLEVPEFVSAIYPSGLEARHDLGSEDLSPASVHLNVAHVREMGVLCLRLETLASGRIFKPVYGNKDSDLPIILDDDDTEQRAPEPWSVLEGDPDSLMPPMTIKCTDHDLLMILDSLTCRIQNALHSIIKRFNACCIDTSRIMGLLEDGGIDPKTLALLGELVGNIYM